MKISYLITYLSLLSTGASAFQGPITNTKHLSLSASNANISQTQPSSTSLLAELNGGGKKEPAVSPDKIEGRQNRVKKVYKVLIAETGLFSAVIFAKSRNPFYSTGPLLASAVSYILLGAAEHDRLSSDTYKRLNLGLFIYGFIALFAGVLMKFPPIWAVSCVIAMVNSVKGYGYGVKGWELSPDADVKADIINGLKGNLKTMVSVPNLMSAGYLTGTVTLVTLMLTKIREIVDIIQSGSGNYMLGQRLFRLSMFKIMSVIMFTLKDAADRNRLEGTTFIQLNGMVSISFMAWAWESYRKAAFAPLDAGICIFFAAFTGLSAISNAFSKKSE